jgi:SAM-dependent methyltransferase
VTLAAWTYQRFWQSEVHPYQILRRRLAALVQPGMTVLDAGCGYTAPTLNELRGKGAKLIGVDVVPLEPNPELTLIECDLAQIPLPSTSVDLIYSRSVMEHVTDPTAVYAETARLLRPGGRWIFLTANRWDYVSLIARMTPNRLHGAVVRAFEGRDEVDVFPTAYRTNDRRQITRCAKAAGFAVEHFEYLSQYPSMFMKWGGPFLLATLYEKLLINVPLLAPLRGWLLVELTKSAENA